MNSNMVKPEKIDLIESDLIEPITPYKLLYERI